MDSIFFRVANIETHQGLWYDWEGSFTGLIHHRFNFCTNKDLPMPYDKKLVGWLSATDDLETLWSWFTKEDVLNLQKHGWFVYAYLAKDSKEYKNHKAIKQDTSKPILRFEINEDLEIGTVKKINE